jgi:hypothetical protein
MVKISLLVVVKAVHIEVIILKSVLTCALEENLGRIWHTKQFDQVSWWDHNLTN